MGVPHATGISHSADHWRIRRRTEETDQRDLQLEAGKQQGQEGGDDQGSQLESPQGCRGASDLEPHQHREGGMNTNRNC